MAGYSGTPLVKKLGIAAGHRVLLDGAPAGFELDAPGADIDKRASAAPYDIILCFCTERARLMKRWPVLHGRTTQAGSLWIAWPKRSSGVTTDLDEHVVRDFALANGRVDVKVCAIDDTWSGLKHVIRVGQRR